MTRRFQARRNRRERRIEKLFRASRLPPGNTLDTLDRSRFPLVLNHQIDARIDGSFLDRHENILAFSYPGSGESHTVCAIAYELILQGHRVLFRSCEILIQELLVAKRDFKLPVALKKLNGYTALIIDVIGLRV